MPDALTTLPARPLHPRPPFQGGWSIQTILGILLFGGFLVFSVVWVAPVVFTDWQVRNTAVPIRGGHLSDGSCTSKLFLKTCDVTLTAPAGSDTITRSVHYAFASFTDGDLTARVVADPQRPEWLTTDLGLDYFWNRLVSLLLDLGLILALLVGAIRGMMRASRTRTAWHKSEMVPVPLKLVRMQKVRAGTVWTVRAENGKTARWTVPHRAKPFVLGPTADRVLGLMVKGGGSIIPLDAGLRWVALSDAERAAALAMKSRPSLA